MQTVAERLAGQLADLRYDHPVQRIRWGGGPHGVQVSCANGVTLQADAVVVTASLGVLKAQHGQLFEPPLPGHTRAAIERLCIGTVDKLFLDFTPPASGGGSSSAASQQHNGAAAEASTAQASGAEQVVSYALLWGGAWDGDASVAAPLTAAEAQLPEWARGIFSIRFGGPEVKQRRPAQKQQSSAATGGTGETIQDRQRDDAAAELSPCAAPAQPTCYQAVAWITGEAAAAMEAASDEEVLEVLRRLACVFPQLQLPTGASWDTVTLHR
jgi:spermine oxidase